MKIDILTLFPEMFRGPFDESIIKRAKEKGQVEINLFNLRAWTTDKHKTVDDRPFGGGTGMVLKVEPVFKALRELKSQNRKPATAKTKVILMTPQGKPFKQSLARKLARLDQLILVCGHYEGVDERIREHLVDEEISIGDFILTGGELPAMLVADAIVRLLPGVLEKPEATRFESFSGPEAGNPKIGNLLEYPHYTRPADFRGWKVPEILLNGHHREIQKWRVEQSFKRTRSRRPDLLKTTRKG